MRVKEGTAAKQCVEAFANFGLLRVCVLDGMKVLERNLELYSSCLYPDDGLFESWEF